MLELAQKAIEAVNNVGTGLHAVAEAINNYKVMKSGDHVIAGTTQPELPEGATLCTKCKGKKTYRRKECPICCGVGYTLATVEEPAVEEPAVEEPEVEPATVEEPAVEEPATVEEPAVEEPAVEEPAVEEPAVEEPAVEEVEEPKAVTLKDLRKFGQKNSITSTDEKIWSGAKKAIELFVPEGVDPKLGNVPEESYGELLEKLKELVEKLKESV